jgi:transmembrane sensor
MAERGRGSLDEALEALRADVEASGAPAGLWARVAAGAAGPRRVAWSPAKLVLTGALVAAVGLGALLGWWRARPAELAGFQVTVASADLRVRVEEGGVLRVEAGKASLRVAELGADVAVAGGTQLRREGKGVRLVRGAAIFEVEPRPAEPAVVFVSGGRIEVLGTRFAVEQGEAEGAVTLERGSIRFVDEAGRETLLRPGDRLRWPPSPALPAPAPPPRRPSPAAPALPAVPPRRTPQRTAPPSPAPPASARASGPLPAPAEVVAQQQRVLAEIDRLRIRREDDLLVRRLDDILASPVAEPFRERLSFERCDVLAHQAGQEVRACAEVARHVSAYPQGEYTARLESLRRSLGCTP